MQRMKRTWKQIPDKPRRILILILGMLLVITAPLIGWIPGPGGTIVFLLGIAVLATEFEWAERFRDWILDQLRCMKRYALKHKVWSAITLAGAIVGFSAGAYYFYTHVI